MQFTADRDILLSTLKTVYRAIPAKALHQLADHFAFEFVSEDRLIVTGTDGVTTIIGAVKSYQTSDPTGRIVVHAKTLLDYVRNLPHGAVTFDAGSQFLVVASGLGGSRSNIPLADAMLYPKTPKPEEVPSSQWYAVPREQFIEALSRVAPAVPSDATQPNLFMVSVQQSPQTDNTVLIACSPGARLHRVEVKNFLLPDLSISALCLTQLNKALSGVTTEYVSLWHGKTGFVVKCGLDYIVFSSPKLAYPDVQKALMQPTLANSWKLYVERDAFRRALIRAAGTVDETTRAAIIRLSSKGTLTIETKNAVGAKVEEILEVPWPYDDITLVFNVKHILDALAVYPAAMCDIRVADPKLVPNGAVRLVDEDAMFDAVLSQLKLELL